MPSSLLVVGGARSGKSRFALESASGLAGVFVATAEAGDADMAQRIERHRRERPNAWRTIEEPRQLVSTLRALVGGAQTVVVDCVTLWVGNLQLHGESDERIFGEADALVTLIAARPFDLTLVSNEVGEGVHPETAAGLRFRDLLGVVNQRLAAACDRVVLMVAGVPLTVKDQPGKGSLRAGTPQAP